MSGSSLKEGEQIRGSGASTAGGTIVSASTTSVSSILSSLSAGLFTTIVPREESGRAPEPFGTGFAHFALVSAHATTPSTPCLPRERHTSDVSGYRTDPSISFDVHASLQAPASSHAKYATTLFHALLRALLHKAHYLV